MREYAEGDLVDFVAGIYLHKVVHIILLLYTLLINYICVMYVHQISSSICERSLSKEFYYSNLFNQIANNFSSFLRSINERDWHPKKFFLLYLCDRILIVATLCFK